MPSVTTAQLEVCIHVLPTFRVKFTGRDGLTLGQRPLVCLIDEIEHYLRLVT